LTKVRGGRPHDLDDVVTILPVRGPTSTGIGCGPPYPGAHGGLQQAQGRGDACELSDRKLLDGVGFLHAGGRLRWGRTSIVAPGGEELLVWGDRVALAPTRLARTTITVGGLRAGTRVRVLFEDRALTAADGFFVDDFRGRDLYQRFDGRPMLGEGNPRRPCTCTKSDDVAGDDAHTQTRR
jgi:hypothetical protein